MAVVIERKRGAMRKGVPPTSSRPCQRCARSARRRPLPPSGWWPAEEGWDGRKGASSRPGIGPQRVGYRSGAPPRCPGL